ncbi:HIT zinc finger family protein [Apiospora arundinis]
MNNFGVIEVAGAKTTNAPGWAYVPDTGHPGLSHQHPLPALLNSKNRKRAARSTAGGPNLSYADLSARQEAKVRKELEVLDRDNPRDVSIPIPAKPKGSGRDTAKHTPNVRKILQSQKTFANHLDDWLALKEGGGGGAGNVAASAAATAAGGRKGSAVQQQQNKKSETPTARGGGASSSKQQQSKQEDVEMTDAPDADSGDQAGAGGSTILSPYRGPLPAPHPRDGDPLLVSRVPSMPTDEELEALLTAPPLTYLEARAGWGAEDRKHPVRVFCEVCGYWGRVKCIKCGTRVCALDCLDTHREDCVTRYGL